MTITGALAPTCGPRRTWWMYVVECADGTLYCGSTNQLQCRIDEHNEGKGAKYTRGRRPVRMVFHVERANRSEAQKAEARFKKMGRGQKLATIRKGEWPP